MEDYEVSFNYPQYYGSTYVQLKNEYPPPEIEYRRKNSAIYGYSDLVLECKHLHQQIMDWSRFYLTTGQTIEHEVPMTKHRVVALKFIAYNDFYRD